MPEVEFAYDNTENILFVNYPPSTKWEKVEQVRQVFARCQQEIEQIGHKVFVAVDLSNLSIPLDQRLMEEISRGIRHITAGGFLYAYIRFNATDITTATNVRVSSMRADVSSNIVYDHEAAIIRARQLVEDWKANNPSKMYPEKLQT